MSKPDFTASQAELYDKIVKASEFITKAQHDRIPRIWDVGKYRRQANNRRNRKKMIMYSRKHLWMGMPLTQKGAYNVIEYVNKMYNKYLAFLVDQKSFRSVSEHSVPPNYKIYTDLDKYLELSASMTKPTAGCPIME